MLERLGKCAEQQRGKPVRRLEGEEDAFQGSGRIAVFILLVRY